MKSLLLKTIIRTFLTLGFIFAGSFFLAQLTPASAAEYYVAGDTGLDTNPGTSSQPWKTIQKAADVMVAGDTVNVKGGVVYTGNNSCWGNMTVVCPRNTGSVGSRITYQPWEGTGMPIIDALGTNFGFHIRNLRQYITISGFNIKNAQVQQIYISGDGVIVKNSIISSDNLQEEGINSFSFSVDTQIINNTFINLSNAIFTGTIVNNSVIKNNIFVNISGTAGTHWIGDGTGLWDNNLYHNNGTNYDGTGEIGPNDIHADPLFVDTANGDFRLQPNSPAINAGADVSAYGVTTDILGRARPNAGAFDIGAYEDPNIYVAGDVASSGNGSMQSPFKTIQEAANVTTPGDVVNVKGGGYKDLIYSIWNPNYPQFAESTNLWIRNSGTQVNPITYQSWKDTGVPLIKSENTGKGVYIDANNITIMDLHISNSGKNVDENNEGCIRTSNTSRNDIKIINNILTSCTGMGIMLQGNRHYIGNNTFNNETVSWMGGAYAIRLFNANDVSIMNNIISNLKYTFQFSNSTDININHNIYFNITTPVTVSDASDIFADPLFIDPANGDFRLQPNSPAINAGTDVSAYGVNKDILSVPRPQGAGYDIGAFEFYSVPVSIASPTGAYLTTTSTTVTGVATTTSTATITNVEYSLDNGAWTSATGNFSFVLSNLAQGSHTVKVRATDSYGNQTHESQYATKTFTVDSIVPTLKIEKLGLIGSIPNKSKLTYYFTSQTPRIEAITEPNSTIEFTVDNNTRTATADMQGALSIKFDSPKLMRGFNVITYRAVDRAGNTSETRTLNLIIGEEFFPDWLYSLVVDKGENIENVDQNEKQEDIEKETKDKEYPVVTTYEILIKNNSGDAISNTKIKIGDKYYTTNEEGKILIPITTGTVLRYEIEGVLGEFLFNPDKKINEIIVEIPPKSEGIKMEGKEFNWLWLVISLILLLGSGAWYSYNKRKI